jgi:hypothetical protein
MMEAAFTKVMTQQPMGEDTKFLKMDATSSKAGVQTSSDVKVDEIIPTILNEIKSLKEETASAKADIEESIKEAMSRGMRIEVEKDVKQPSVVSSAEKVASIQTNEKIGERLDRLESSVCSMQMILTDMKDMARGSERMRRIDFMLCNIASIPLFNAYSQQIVNENELFVKESGVEWVEWNFRGFVYDALTSFRHGGGICLPFRGLYNDKECTMDPPPDEVNALTLKFYDMIVKHFCFLLGPGVRLEEDEEGKTMLFFDEFQMDGGKRHPEG